MSLICQTSAPSAHRATASASKNTDIIKRRSNSSTSRDQSKFLKMLFKRQTMLELFFSSA